ncbi:hypothetical protein VZT92_004542 [Zoarces viviparus]|uniref:Gag protein n=1 Tax=Zoarces viviparus TaxID=48416 RepID=A0AAW1FX46_ZOAVI
MSDEKPPTLGAVALEDTALRDAVADVLKLTETEREYFTKYTAALCDEQLEELVAYVNNPAGKKQRLIQDVIGAMLLTYHQKMQLRAAERKEQSDALHREMRSLQEEVQQLGTGCQTLQSENASLSRDLQEIHAELSETLESNDRLKALQYTQRNPNNRHEEIPETPVSTETPHTANLGSYRAPQPSHFLDSGASVPEGRTTLRFDRTASPTRGREDKYQVLSGPSGFSTTSTGERYPPHSSRGRQARTPSPLRREDSRLYRPRGEYGGSDDSDGPGPIGAEGLRTRQIESLAKDVERFDPGNRESSIDDYLREIDRCLLDLSRPSSREKLKLIWKTTARSVHVFMETLQPGVRDRYSSLCQALREEYSLYPDPASATLGAFAISQGRLEAPRDYFRRLRSAYFQGRNAPGLEEDQAFKSLFLHNLHDSVRYDVTMHCRTSNLTMPEIRKYAQLAWETRGRPIKRHDDTARVLGIQRSGDPDLALEGNERPRPRDPRPPPRNQRPWRSEDQRNQGGERHPQGQNHGRPWQQPPSHPKKRFDRNPLPTGRYNGRAPTPPEKEVAKPELESLIRKYVQEAVKQLGKGNPEAKPPTSSGKPDPNSPST